MGIQGIIIASDFSLETASKQKWSEICLSRNDKRSSSERRKNINGRNSDHHKERKSIGEETNKRKTKYFFHILN